MEYRIAKGWRITVAVFGAVLIIGGVFFLIKAFTGPTFPAGLGIFLAIFLISLGTITYLDTIRTLFIIDGYNLRIVRLRKTRSVLLKEIDGYRTGDKNTFFIVLKKGDRSIQLPQYLERREELIGWFQEKYEDVDERDKANETEALLDNDQFGLTREDRASRLATAKRISYIATGAGALLFFWALFDPEPFDLIMIILLAAPWIAVYITWYYKGLMKLYKTKSSPYPSLVYLIFLTILAALVTVLNAYSLYAFGQHAWSLLLGITLTVTVISITACRQAIATSGKVLVYGIVFAIAGMYSYSLLIFSNCRYDRSFDHAYHVKVTHKRISSGKSTSYYLSLSPWGKYADGNELSVSKSFYNQVNTHDDLTVFLRKGQWGIPWYFLKVEDVKISPK